MIRTQIRFDEKEYALIKKQARALGVPIAELVRQTLPQGNQPPWMRYSRLRRTRGRQLQPAH
jgi:hypothetical protein